MWMIKLLKKAIEEGVDSTVISERYIAECRKDMESLNVKPATTHPQATQEICGMLEMIEKLIEDGHAYAAADGTVYFRVRSFKEYGKLSHKNLDDLEGGKRSLLVSGEDQKEDPWISSSGSLKDGEPYWESPWCNSRPGWHIECSVMSKNIWVMKLTSMRAERIWYSLIMKMRLPSRRRLTASLSPDTGCIMHS